MYLICKGKQCTYSATKSTGSDYVVADMVVKTDIIVDITMLVRD